MRRLLKWVFVLLLIVLVPVMGLWVYNQIDEDPSPDSIRLARPFQQSVDDRENAWLYLLGIDASVDEDPLSLGRRRLDTHTARVLQVPDPEPSELETALRAPRIRYRVPEEGSPFCPSLTDDCVSWAGRKGTTLNQLAQQNAVLLDRYRSAFEWSSYEELAVPHLDLMLPRVRIDELSRNLLLLDIHQQRFALDMMPDIARAGLFWRGAASGSRTLAGKLMAQRRIAGYQALVIDLFEHAEPLNRGAVGDLIEHLLAPPTDQERSLEPAARFEYQTFVETMRDYLASNHPVWNCVSAFDQCNEAWIRTFLVPQATDNIAASNWSVIERVWQAPADQYQDVNEVLGAEIAARMPKFDTLQYFLKNAPGKILAAIAVPAYLDYAHQTHDHEAFRRLLYLKYLALRDGIETSAMSPWLASLGDELRNPYTGEAYDWDPSERMLFFQPRSEHWGRDRVAVSVNPLPMDRH